MRSERSSGSVLATDANTAGFTRTSTSTRPFTSNTSSPSSTAAPTIPKPSVSLARNAIGPRDQSGGLLDGKLYPLFNPRKQSWNRHFRWEQTTLVGKTKTGIVTVQVLNMNNASRLMLRELLLFAGQFPPD